MIKDTAQVYIGWTIGKVIGRILIPAALLTGFGWVWEQAEAGLNHFLRAVGALSLVLPLFMLVSPAQAGMAVSDATSYIYYVQQLEKLQKQLDTQMDTLKEVQDVYQETAKVYDSVTGVYLGAEGMLTDLKRLQARLKKTSSLLDYLEELFPDDEEAQKTYRDLGYIETASLLEDQFKDSASAEVDPFEQWQKKRTIQQAAIEDAIVEAEDIVQGSKDDLGRLNKLIEEIKGTQDLKAAQDLSNHFLAEILAALHDMKHLEAQYVAMEGYFKYDGKTADLDSGDTKNQYAWKNDIQELIDDADDSEIFSD
jgi:hypothetical protein